MPLLHGVWPTRATYRKLVAGALVQARQFRELAWTTTAHAVGGPATGHGLLEHVVRRCRLHHRPLGALPHRRGAHQQRREFSRPARTGATRRRFPTLLLAAQLLERRLLSRVAAAGDGTRPIRAILAFHRTARQRIQISVRPIHRNVDDALGAWVCARNAALRA